jgi:hypothetical protein
MMFALSQPVDSISLSWVLHDLLLAKKLGLPGTTAHVFFSIDLGGSRM